MDSTKTDSYQTPKSCFILSRVQRIRWTRHLNFRMARHFLPDRHYLPGRWTTSVSTQSIRFVSIHPIATGIATVSLWMKDSPESWIWMNRDKWKSFHLKRSDHLYWNMKNINVIDSIMIGIDFLSSDLNTTTVTEATWESHPETYSPGETYSN